MTSVLGYKLELNLLNYFYSRANKMTPVQVDQVINHNHNRYILEFYFQETYKKWVSVSLL